MRLTGLLLMFSGGTLLALAFWGLWQDIEWIAQPFYAFAWWAYIFLLDGFCVLCRGQSIFTSRWRFVVPICLWSVSFWFLFELLNVRFQNWYYVGVIRGDVPMALVFGGSFGGLAFATVFMGIFQTFESLAVVGVWTSVGRPRDGAFPPWGSYVVQLAGAMMAGLAIAFPFYLAPLIWGSFTFLIDPWNYRRGARSLLRDCEVGDWRSVIRLLAAGLICGFVWESLNFFAPQKWIYTVRGLEGFKLFEMPLLGFLGFPALALDAVTGFAFLAFWFLGNETWEDLSILRYSLRSRKPVSKTCFLASIPLHIVFWLFVSVVGTPVNIGSWQLELKEYLNFSEVKSLAKLNILRPRQLSRALKDPHQREAILVATDWTPEECDRILERTRLFVFKGIGYRHGRLLGKAGVERLSDLAISDPYELHERLKVAAVESRDMAPRLDMVRVWVFAAQDRGIIQLVED